MISSKAVRNIIGRPVQDIYGRYAGSVIGVSVDMSGQLRSVGIDHGMGAFSEYPSNLIVFDNDAFVLVPEWRIQADRLAKEKAQMQRRSSALEELRKEGEIPKHVYEEIHMQYDGDLQRLQETNGGLITSLQKRMEELDGRKGLLEKFAGSIKVQHRAGELDEETFRAISDHIKSMLDKDSQEKREVSAVLNTLTLPPSTESTGEEAPRTEESLPQIH